MTEGCDGGSGDVNYNPETGVYSSSYDENLPSIAIMEVVAEIMDEDVTELDSLHEVTAIDVNALDKLFKPRVVGSSKGDDRLTFTYKQYEITVFSFGRIEIKPLNEDE